MRRIVGLGALLVAGVAVAGTLPEATIDLIATTPGFVVVEASKPGTCTGTEDGWTDPGARLWMKQHAGSAVAVPWTREQIEPLVGDGPRPAALRLAFQDGHELDRACGCMTGPQLTSWLETVSSGQTRASATASAMAMITGTYPVDGWLEVVQLHVCANRPADAFAVAKQLWDDIPTKAPERRDVRLSRVVRDLGVIARKHAPSMVALVAMRDALDAPKDADADALDAWVALNRAIGDDDRTFAWYDAKRSDPASAALIARVAPNVFWMLAEAGRWADAGRVVGDPVAWLATWRAQVGGPDAAIRGYAALSAADHDRDAAALAKAMLKSDPAVACRLIAQVTEVGAVDKLQAPVAKRCAEEPVVDAWEAKL